MPHELKNKPYGFVSLPDEFTEEEPVWHDGSCSTGRLSGEVRFEMTNLTPLLVGWERRRLSDRFGDGWNCYPWGSALLGTPDTAMVTIDSPWGPITTKANKSLLCPLQAPWEGEPVLVPGDSLKGLLRHELGAIWGAPMERVAERSYSYRPNLTFPAGSANRRLEPRLARVMETDWIVVDGTSYPIPCKLDVLDFASGKQNYNPAPGLGEPYRGGMGAGKKLPEGIQPHEPHHHLAIAGLGVAHASYSLRPKVCVQYANTLRHLTSIEHGHFSSRHPNIGKGQQARESVVLAVKAAAASAFQLGDLIWVEWDSYRNHIRSFGWHYYYRWAYQDTVRLKSWSRQRKGLFPTEAEIGSRPRRLTLVRRLLGYSSDNAGSLGIGIGQYSQLMGRVSVNAAIEIVATEDTMQQRFLPPTFLRELGMPRPSAVEFYLGQPHSSTHRPSDKARLLTYGDVATIDSPGDLAGRKFYLDRGEADHATWGDNSQNNVTNDRSTLALNTSREGRRFRFTARFRDLEPGELATLLLALCPDQFAIEVGGNHEHGYCSKLGYARPLGWGSVRIVAKELIFIELDRTTAVSRLEPSITTWFRSHRAHITSRRMDEWLAVHRRNNPDASSYPSDGGPIYSYHTGLRREHATQRRYT